MTSAVVINFFPAFRPPSSGGEMRLGDFYRALSRTVDVTLLTSTDFGARFEEVEHTPRFRELRFPKDELWRSAYATCERSGLTGELSGLAFALAVSDPGCDLRQRAKSLAAQADVVIHEFPFSEPIFADGCPCPEIYNSHNFEISMLSAIMRGDGIGKAIQKLMRLEGNLVARAQRVFATSEDDAEKFRLFYGVDASKIGLCPNGFDHQELAPIVKARKRRADKISVRPKLFFIGSAHHPNVEAAEFLVSIASDLADCEILLAGSVCNALANRALPGNLTLVGLIDPVAKHRLFTEADVFVNPVVLGSGTSLKALEALGASLAMVSTPEGVRGLGLAPGLECEIVSRGEFVTAIRRLVSDATRRANVAAAGLAVAHERFSWSRIATNFGTQIASTASKRSPQRPLVLALNDYPVSQSRSGGVARMRGLHMNLDCDVVLLSFGPSFDVGLIGPGIMTATLPKTHAHRAFEDAVNSGQPMSVNDGVASLFAGSNQALVDLTCAIASRAQAVVFEHPYMAPLLDAIHAVRPDMPIVYSAHNVEATHKREILRGHRMAKTLTNFIADLERRLAAHARMIICCTEADAAHFTKANPEATTIVVPNGCAPPDENTIKAARHAVGPDLQPRVGFLASSHGPNVEAARFIVGEIATALSEVRFELIGAVCEPLNFSLPTNVVLHGAVDENAKTAVMAAWDIALNPVQSGGGSSLKLPDYMAHAVATLNTPAGARGFSVEERGAGRVVDRRRFVEVLKIMLGDRKALSRQKSSARRYASQELSWNAVTLPYRQSLLAIIQPPPRPSSSKLLVVTYRYTEPSLGGAEEYLIEILKRLRTRYTRLDLAAIDINDLTNQHHYGCRLSIPRGGASGRLTELFDRACFFEPDEVSEAETLERARIVERAWSEEESELLSRFVPELRAFDRLRLFAGFFWPENHDGVIRRWTSPKFSFLAPQHARTFRIAGYAGKSKTLAITLLQFAPNGRTSVVAQIRQPIPPYFAVNVALPKPPSEFPLCLACEVEEHHAAGDHRPFGVLLDSASVLIDEGGGFDAVFQGIGRLRESSADLSEQCDEELRVADFDRWVSALRDLAMRRDPSIEAEFAAVRGPHSRALQAWLGAHAHEYDAVLVQGIPFDLIPSSVETLSRLRKRPRVVTLPHFHGDDRFYHWRRYFESFAMADATLLFSSSIAEQLKSISTGLVVVPGGGVRADEHGDPIADRNFRKVHESSKPYFLVLGRKTASKGYEQTLRSHQALREAGIDIELVMIGPDEDGRAVKGAGVHYLGRQPRDVIRGALRSCLAVVNMSRSESFGIVLCEAWLFGKPVIANRVCYSFRELVRDGETGFLVTTDTELTEAMKSLASDVDARGRMGRAGFQDVVTNFTWERVAESCFDALMPNHFPRERLKSTVQVAGADRPSGA